VSRANSRGLREAGSGNSRQGLSCPPALAQIFLAQALPSFAARYPLVRVQVSILNRPVDLIEERIDVALRARSNLQADPNLMMRVFGRGRSILVASRAFVAGRGPVTIATLSRLPALSPRDDARDTWQLVGPDAVAVDIPIEARIACIDFKVLLSAACAGLGVALLPEYVCEKTLRSQYLVRVMPEWFAPEVTLHMVFTARRGLPPAVRAFIDHVAASQWGAPPL